MSRLIVGGCRSGTLVVVRGREMFGSPRWAGRYVDRRDLCSRAREICGRRRKEWSRARSSFFLVFFFITRWDMWIKAARLYSRLESSKISELFELHKLSDPFKVRSGYSNSSNNCMIPIIQTFWPQSRIAAASEYFEYLDTSVRNSNFTACHLKTRTGEHTQHQTRRNESAPEQFRWRDKEKTETRQRHRQSRWHTRRRKVALLDTFAFKLVAAPRPIRSAGNVDAVHPNRILPGRRCRLSWRADGDCSPRYRGFSHLSYRSFRTSAQISRTSRCNAKKRRTVECPADARA